MGAVGGSASAISRRRVDGWGDSEASRTYQPHLMFGRESHGREVCSRCGCDGSRSRARDGGWCMCVILMHRAAADRREPESLRGRCADRRTLGGNIAISDRLANRHDAGAFPSVPVLKAGRPDDPATLRQGQRPPTSSRRQGGRAVKRHSGQGSRRLVMHDVVRAWAPAAGLPSNEVRVPGISHLPKTATFVARAAR